MKGPAFLCQYDLHPRAVNMAEAVAETYATPSWVVVKGDFALRLVKFTRALNDWLTHCQNTTAGAVLTMTIIMFIIEMIHNG